MATSLALNSTKKAEDFTFARQNCAQAIEHGRSTLESLDLQDEKLRQVEDTLEANEYILQKSMKIMRGMTWSGMMYNLTTSNPTPPTQQSSSAQRAATGRESSAIAATTPPNITLLPVSSRSAIDDIEGLDEVHRSLCELHSIGLTIGEALDHQNNSLDRVQSKAENAYDKTLAVTLKASQLSQRTKKSKEVHLGTFQFVNDATASLLCVGSDNNLYFQQHADKSTCFECFVKEGNLIGLQSMKTLKFVGVTMFGSVSVMGEWFGKQEECHMDLSGIETGIFFLARNWGSGGWLRHGDDITKHLEQEKLDGTTNNISDKANCVLLRALCISTKN